MAYEKGVLGQGGPTGPVVPQGLSQAEMDRVQAGRFVPQPQQSAPTPNPNLSQLGAGALTATAVSNTGGWTVPNLNPNAVDWKAPDLAAYDKQFGESLAASRANIANQFQRAMEDIAAQEGIANQVVGTLPGRYGDIWGGAEQRTKEAAGRATTALERSGLGGFLTQEELMAPQMAGLQGGRAGFEATVPLTQLGTQELFTRQKGALGQARLGAEAPLDEAAREWVARRAQLETDINAREMAFRQQEAEREQERQRFLIQQQAEESRFTRSTRSEENRANAQIRAQKEAAKEDRSITPYQQAQLDLEREKMAAGTAKEAKEFAASVPVFSRQQVGFQKGELLTRGDPATVAAAGGHDAAWFRKEEGYTTLKKEFDKKYPKGVKPDQVEKAREFLLDKARGKPWDNDLSILLYDKGLDDSELGLGSLLPEKKKEKGFGKGGWGWWR